jgi:hypothetical protein
MPGRCAEARPRQFTLHVCEGRRFLFEQSDGIRGHTDRIYSSIKEHGLTFLLTHSNGPVQRYLPLLRNAARSGSAWASLCVAFDQTVPAKDRRGYAGKALRLPDLNPELRELLERV